MKILCLTACAAVSVGSKMPAKQFIYPAGVEGRYELWSGLAIAAIARTKEGNIGSLKLTVGTADSNTLVDSAIRLRNPRLLGRIQMHDVAAALARVEESLRPSIGGLATSVGQALIKGTFDGVACPGSPSKKRGPGDDFSVNVDNTLQASLSCSSAEGLGIDVKFSTPPYVAKVFKESIMQQVWAVRACLLLMESLIDLQDDLEVFISRAYTLILASGGKQAQADINTRPASVLRSMYFTPYGESGMDPLRALSVTFSDRVYANEGVINRVLIKSGIPEFMSQDLRNIMRVDGRPSEKLPSGFKTYLLVKRVGTSVRLEITCHQVWRMLLRYTMSLDPLSGIATSKPIADDFMLKTCRGLFEIGEHILNGLQFRRTKSVIRGPSKARIKRSISY